MLIEKRWEYNLKAHLFFIDYERAFDDTEEIFWRFKIYKCSRYIVNGNIGLIYLLTYSLHGAQSFLRS
jgi:hypothetical protein